MEKKSAVFLIGFMGAGKTTFGKKLAAKMNKELVDLDAQIIRAHQAEKENIFSIKEIIEQNGMVFFRELEKRTLRQLNFTNKVIATGGGTPCYFDNLEWMKQKGTVVFLEVEEGVLFSRLKTTDLEERPLLKNLSEEELKNFIHKKLQERLPFYQKADIIFNPVKQRIEELANYLFI